MKMFAEVIVNRPVEGPFTYSIPDEFKGLAKVGSIVEVSFGRRIEIGYIVAISYQTELRNLKPILRVISDTMIIKDEILRLTKWISEYYYCSWGEALSAAVPSVIKRPSKHRRRYKRRRRLEFEFIDGSDRHLQPTLQQAQALEIIKSCIDERKHKVFLLYGVTGSGKTEVYLQSISYAIEKGFSSIVLVPEISLTPQTVARFTARFRDKIAVLHSRLGDSERASEWQRIISGEAQIVVGARSAIFAPVKDLGLVVVDEEHETSYKQEDVPRYHARDVAIKRAELSDASVILGSATPSLESFYLAEKGMFQLIELSERIDSRMLPDVDIIDMKEEFSKAKRFPIFSQHLKEWIEKDIHEERQVILFLNRRGFSTFVNCRRCGYVIKCKRCSVSLTYHSHMKRLACHHCNFTMDPPDICPQCNSSYIKYWGIGTEKVESECHRLFPYASIARLDTDITKKRDAHLRILSKFKDKKIDILIGTQMIAKGLDFPKVTLVGVISADTALNLPDFRSAERTFNLLTQVAGRAGRSDLGGKVIIQTYTPHHYAIQAAKNHDYLTFYTKEIAFRKELNLPPFCHLVNIIFRGRKEADVLKSAEDLKSMIEKEDRDRKMDVLGPAPSPISRMRGMFRWNISLRAEGVEDILPVLKSALNNVRKKGIIITVDVDPI